VAVVATEPLTRDEIWHNGKPGSMWVFSGGVLRATLPSGQADREPRTKRAPSAAARRAA
jgi:glutamine amidotransferase